MNDRPRETLGQLIRNPMYGRSLCEDPRRCEALLRDLCGEHRREISVLIGALEERVAADLLASHDSLPKEVLLARLTKRLQDDLALAENAARWGVETWALALGIISEEECKQQAREDPGGRVRRRSAGERAPSQRLARAPGPPALLPEKPALSLGEIPESDPKIELIRIQNVGETDFHGKVELLYGSDWLEVDPTTVVLRPKKSLALRITAYSPSGSPGQDHKETIAIQTDQGVALSIDVTSATPRPKLEIDQTEIVGDNVWLGGRLDRYFRIQNAGTAVLEGQIEEDPPVSWLEAIPDRFRVEPGNSRPIRVAFDAEGAIFGTTYFTTLRVHSSGGNASVQAEMRVESEESNFSRFRMLITPLMGALGLSIGLLLAAISTEGADLLANVVGFSFVLFGIAVGQEAHQRGGWPAAFWWGIGAGVAALVTLLIADAISTAPFSAIAWAFTLGSATWLLARLIFRAYANAQWGRRE